MDVDGIDATEDLSTLLAEDTTSSEQVSWVRNKQLHSVTGCAAHPGSLDSSVTLTGQNK